MSWIIAGMAAAGALQGAANQKKMERHNQYRAEAIKYSPWTGMGDPGEKNLPDALQSALQGASMGAMVSGGMGKGGGEAAQGKMMAGEPAMGGMGGGMGGQMPMSPEQQKWMLMNQSQGGPGYTMDV